MIKLFSIFLLVFFSIQFNSFSKTKLNGIDQVVWQLSNKIVESKSPSTLSNKDLPNPFYIENGLIKTKLLIKTSNSYELDKLLELGAEIIFNVDNIYGINLPLTSLENTLDLDFVTAAELPKQHESNLYEHSISHVRPDTENESTNIWLNSVQGEGVIIGVFDSGIDFNHSDFKNENGSKILYLWDMSETQDIQAPDGYDWGKEYTKQMIDNSPESINQKDDDSNGGHGTHVAGTAAGGNSINDKYRGVAFESDLIIVKGTREGETSFDQLDIIAGVQYIFNKAEVLGKPAVVNLSLGSIVGPHDGSTIYEQALTALTGPGRILVTSAGNSGNLPIHAGTKANAGESPFIILTAMNVCELIKNFCPELPGFYASAMDLWYEAGTLDSIGISKINPMTFQQTEEFIIRVGEANQNIPLMNENEAISLLDFDARTINHPENGDGNLFIMLHNGAQGNIVLENTFWVFQFYGTEGPKFDLWASAPVPEGMGIPLLPSLVFGDNQMTVGSPGTAKGAISVASYVTANQWIDENGETQNREVQIGAISDFSSRGPSRDGRVVPYIAAPGQSIASAMSSHLTPDIGYRLSSKLQGEPYILMNGTSMAAPQVTGAVALLLSQNPELDVEDVKNMLREYAVFDEFTETVPNNTWGYGKLNATNALVSMNIGNVTLTRNQATLKLYPNPSTGEINIEVTGEINQLLNYSVVNNQGIILKNINPNSNNTQIQVSDLPNGSYFFRIEEDGKFHYHPFIITK